MPLVVPGPIGVQRLSRSHARIPELCRVSVKVRRRSRARAHVGFFLCSNDQKQPPRIHKLVHINYIRNKIHQIRAGRNLISHVIEKLPEHVRSDWAAASAFCQSYNLLVEFTN